MTFQSNLYLLRLQGVSIFEQLQLEEALLRVDTRNFFILNEFSPTTIVLGISAQPDSLVDRSAASKANIPLIRRFSGGGTVVVDENTVFSTFIGSKNLLFPNECFPEPILRWAETFYSKAFQLPSFSLLENDFVLNSKKCGGNAQYIQRERWLMHTSFLWNFCPQKMELLKFPPKTPEYRSGRSHANFLCPLFPHFHSRGEFMEKIVKQIYRQFSVQEITLEDLRPLLSQNYRRTIQIIPHLED